jgi:hypothetical protein
MKRDYLPQVSDVIRSIRFVYGERSFDENNKRITVGRDEPKYIVSRYPTDDEVVAYVRKYNKMPSEGASVEEDYGSVDLTRAKAEYVVIEAKMQGGGSGMGVIYGHNDEYPDGWHVVAKRLGNGRKWNPNGEEIQFYVTGCFINMIPSNKILKVGEMKLSFA